MKHLFGVDSSSAWSLDFILFGHLINIKHCVVAKLTQSLVREQQYVRMGINRLSHRVFNVMHVL